MVDYLTGRRGASAITTPKPFTRDICGKGNRTTLGKYNATDGSYTLKGLLLDCWGSPLTSDLFRRAAKSIARERARKEGRRVRILSGDGKVLYTTPEVKD